MTQALFNTYFTACLVFAAISGICFLSEYLIGKFDKSASEDVVAWVEICGGMNMMLSIFCFFVTWL